MIERELLVDFTPEVEESLRRTFSSANGRNIFTSIERVDLERIICYIIEELFSKSVVSIIVEDGYPVPVTDTTTVMMSDVILSNTGEGYVDIRKYLTLMYVSRSQDLMTDLMGLSENIKYQWVRKLYDTLAGIAPAEHIGYSFENVKRASDKGFMFRFTVRKTTRGSKWCFHDKELQNEQR